MCQGTVLPSQDWAVRLMGRKRLSAAGVVAQGQDVARKHPLPGCWSQWSGAQWDLQRTPAEEGC